MAATANWQASLSNLLPDIYTILAAAERDAVSAKAVRKALQALYPTLDIKEHKEELDKLIMQAYDNDEAPTNAASSTSSSPAVEVDRKPKVFKAVKRSRSTSPKLPSAPSPKKFKPIPESDAQLAARLSLELNGPPSTRGGRATRGDVSGANAKKVKAWGKAKAKKEPVYDADGNEVIKPVSTTGFNKPWALSEALADIVGVPVLSRPQVTKQLWVYIKKEGLQNPGNGNEIFPDEKLSKVFPVKMITSFKMAQHLKPHLYPVDPKEEDD